jgi:anti-sigma factor ChrR (cupin superfamily)
MMTGDNMPQTKKESPEDGFHFFLMDIQKKMQERGAAFISEMAAPMWEHMKQDERWVYEEQARRKKQNLCRVDFKNKFRPRKRHCARIERVLNMANRQTKMAQEVEETVRARTLELTENPNVPPGARQLILQAWQWQIPGLRNCSC